MGDDKDEKDNLWQHLLGKASSKTKEPNTCIIFLGGKKSGKVHILKRFDGREHNPKSPNYLLDYSFCAVKNIHDDDPDEVRSHMNIWEAESAEQLELIAKNVQKIGLERLVYLVSVDLSEPWDLMNDFNHWLELIEEFNGKLMAKLTPEQQAELKSKISTHNQQFVDVAARMNAEAPIEPADAKAIDYDQPKRNLGVPLIVVGCKGDMMAHVFAAQETVGDHFEFMTRHLRVRCLDYGATLIFSSAKDGTNVPTLQEYIYHRLYGFQQVYPAVTVGTDVQYHIFIPSGYDNMELITAIQPARVSWAPDAAFTDVFKKPEAKKATKPKDDDYVEARDTASFFAEMKTKLDAKLAKQGEKAAKTAEDASEKKAAAAEPEFVMLNLDKPRRKGPAVPRAQSSAEATAPSTKAIIADLLTVAGKPVVAEKKG